MMSELFDNESVVADNGYNSILYKNRNMLIGGRYFKVRMRGRQ